jgi:hypothetical protein
MGDALCWHTKAENWCRQGKIPEYRHPVNNYRLFKVSDLDTRVKTETEWEVLRDKLGKRVRQLLREGYDVEII